MVAARIKRPRSAWILFNSTNRKKLLKNNPKLSFVEVTRLSAANWRQLAPEERRVFVDLRKADIRRYRQEFENLTPEERVALVQKREKKKKSVIKGAVGPYMFFVKDRHRKVRTTNPDLKFADIGKILGQEWKNLSEEHKQPYLKQAQEDRYRFEKESEALVS